MVSPAKRPRQDEETVSCFIHDVSPVNFSANSTEFFNAVLQTGWKAFHDAVVLSPGKRQSFLQAAQNGTPLCLNKVKKALSFRETSGFDMIVNNRTDISVTTVPFAARSPPLQVGLVEAKVLSLSPSTQTVNIRGAEREVRTASSPMGLRSTTCSPIRDLDVPDSAGGSADPQLNFVTGPVHALEIQATMKCSLCGSRCYEEILDDKPSVSHDLITRT
ncbi:hypothetical protein AOLI_G00267020 [Acnodon oligacanthus]